MQKMKKGHPKRQPHFKDDIQRFSPLSIRCYKTNGECIYNGGGIGNAMLSLKMHFIYIFPSLPTNIFIIKSDNRWQIQEFPSSHFNAKDTGNTETEGRIEILDPSVSSIVRHCHISNESHYACLFASHVRLKSGNISPYMNSYIDSV